MEIKLPFDFNQDVRLLLQRCGYAAFTDPQTLQSSFTRRLSRDFYPRFHVYLNMVDGSQVLNLHLDQKKPSYPGAHAHSGEYDGETVQREANRLRDAVAQHLNNQPKPTASPKRGFFQHLLK